MKSGKCGNLAGLIGCMLDTFQGMALLHLYYPLPTMAAAAASGLVGDSAAMQ